MKGGLHHLLVLLDSPLVTFEYATVFALEHLGCIFAAFQLPIKPSDGGKTELSAMRLSARELSCCVLLQEKSIAAISASVISTMVDFFMFDVTPFIF